MVDIRQRRRWIGGSILLWLLCILPWVNVNAAPVAQGGDYPIPGGQFFPQTANGQGGFSVVNDNQARFWNEYQRLGGSQTVGFPISRRFVYDGFVTQAFQKLALQWRPEVGIAYPLNIFDELSEAGHDESLLRLRQTPRPLDDFDAPTWTWQQIIANRQALLNVNPALRARYFSVSDPLNVFGLPTSRVEDMGNHFAIRTQRAVFQQWKEDVPWASAGQVTIANGGSIAHEFNWLPAEAMIPESAPGAPIATPLPTVVPEGVWEPEALLASAGQDQTLWLLQYQEHGTGVTHRLMTSADFGATWSAFSGGLPPSQCINQMTLDYNVPGALYVATCNGLFMWDGATWVRVLQEPIYGLAIQDGNSDVWWAIRSKENGGAQLSRSDNAGRTWRRLATFALGASQLVADSTTNRTLYLLRNEYGSSGGPKLVRLDARNEVISTVLNVGYEPGVFDRRPLALAIDAATGDLYVATDANGSVPMRVWHSQNADDPTPAAVFWQEQSEYAAPTAITYLASGRDSASRLVLYAIFQNFANPAPQGMYTLAHSTDNGQTWQEMTTPR